MAKRLTARVGTAVCVLLVAASASAQNASVERAPAFAAADVQTFVPARLLTGLASADVRQGDWHERGGEFTGIVDEAGTALVLLDEAHQDLSLTTSFRCTASCEAGILLRAEAVDEQTIGVLYVFGEGEVQAQRVTLDPEGRIVRREALEPSPSPYPPQMMAFRAEYPGLGNLNPGELGARRDVEPVDVDGRWNRIELHVVGGSLRGLINGAGTPEAGVSSATPTSLGRIGLYVAGTPGTEIRFRDVGIRPFDEKPALPPEETSPRFRKQHLEAMFYSEAVTAADVNQDGHMDVISGPNIFLGPDFLSRREIYVPRHYAPNEYPDPLLSSAADMTGDGYPDVLHTGEPGRPGFLYVNPGGVERRWEKYRVIPSVDNEIAFLDDLDGDGIPEYIYGDGGYLGYAKPGDDPTKIWTFHPVTEKGPWGAMYAHGLGTGDINGDGRTDIIQAYGWWEQPETLTDAPWTYYPETFGRWGMQQGGPGGGRAYVYDVNDDGLNDVVTSLEGHGFGLAWFEQQRDAAGRISFLRHMIMDDFAGTSDGVSFAALHALALADVDGDGVKDIVTGKRWWAHFGENPSDPDAFGAPVVYWFRLVRDGGEVRFEPELINNHSGVGTDMVAVDLNEDGLADVLTASRHGTIIFLSRNSSDE